jgi:hypothetical protein
MITVLPADDLDPVTTSVQEEVSRKIQLVMWHSRPRAPQPERRSERRQPFPFPTRLLPVDGDGQPCGGGIVVLGKGISERGFGFYHKEPIAERRFIAVFDGGPCQVSILMELNWCRFGSHGLFETGGRFVKAVEMDNHS